MANGGGKVTEEKALTLQELVKRTNQKTPKAEDVKALRKYLAEHPGAWTGGGDLVYQNTMQLLDKVMATPLAKESILAGIEETKKALGYEQSPTIEKLLIEHVLLAKLHYDVITNGYTARAYGGEQTITQGEFWERRLTAAQMRYLRAVETLARVRKMALPAVQVNIATEGGQQVNIAGDLIKGGGNNPGKLAN